MNDASDPALRAELDAGLATLGLDAALAPPLLAYLALLDRWNKTYNLTAIRDPRAMVALHLLDSLAMHPFVRDIGSLADLGSGAGLPGIPLAIARSEEHTSELQSLMRISYAVFCLKQKQNNLRKSHQ